MKYRLGMTAFLAVSLLSACGTTDNATTDTGSTTKTTQDDGKTVVDGVTLKEPAKDEVCAFCNMMVHQKTADMGAFTAQAVDEKGKNLFFDDAGCMLNYEREHDVTLDKYVRNYDDKDWMQLEDAVVVKGDIKTPMKYGFAYFKDEDAATAFIDEHSEAEIVAVSDIDDAAHKKMEAAAGHGSEGHGSDSHDSEGHDEEEHDSDGH